MRRYVIGIDEVGRGALAGPIVVAVAAVPDGYLTKKKKLPSTLKDSKKLSAQQRELWYTHIKADPHIFFASARVGPRGIERLNISGAANTAALKAYTALLLGRQRVIKGRPVFLDGGLFLGSRHKQEAGTIRAKTMPKADETTPAVAIASIIAKVTRDRFMARLAKRHPLYGFEIHKGYGTASHMKAIKKNGPCAAHRLTFLRKKPIIG